MDWQRVWTKQHRDIMRDLEQQGRYIVKRQYIEQENEDTSAFFLEAYTWYTGQAARLVAKPADVSYPVWVSLSEESRLLPGPQRIILELLLPRELIIPVDMLKWSMILNYAYIPSDEEDEARHAQLLSEYGVGDAAAYMSRFYPQIKREIRDSWQRLFTSPAASLTTGTIWEIKQEWVTHII